jgi:V/A-type H+-transporting ATPase subunit I
MSIVPLKRITLYGAAARKEEAIARLQELGCIHFIRLAEEDSETIADRGSADRGYAVDTRRALKYLRACPVQRRQVQRERFDRAQVTAEAIDIQVRERELTDERHALAKAIHDLEPWGEFQLPESGHVAKQRFWFYVIPLNDLKQLAGSETIWREAARDHQFSYVVVLAEQQPEGLPGTQTELDPRPLSELRNRFLAVQEELAELNYRRTGLTRFVDLLAHQLDEADDAAAREHAERISLDAGSVFALQGWVPDSQAAAVRQFGKEHQLAITIEPPGPEDQPPTLLHNPPSLQAGEGCVNFYKTPSYRSWDPSMVVFFSFAAFFAMILADAGYALVIGLLVLWKWKAMGQSVGGQRFRNLLLTIVCFSFLYGVAANSYFGFPLLKPLQLLDVGDFGLMMPLAIGIGVLHLVLANGVTLWRHRGHPQALSAAGWSAVLIGGLIAGIAIMGKLSPPIASTLKTVGVALFAGGLLLVFLFTSQRPLWTLSVKTHLLRVLDGFMGLTRFSSLFGDTLSYLRLFALGLSSARLASTFNDLAAQSWNSAGLGVLLGIVILVVGHGLNLGLSIMSGVVHGLRLNCIEFFNWSLPEEGYLFNAFTKKARLP